MYGGELGKASSPGARAKNDARKIARSKNSNNAGSSQVVDALQSPNPYFNSRPGAGQRFANQLKRNGHRNAGRPQPGMNPSNPWAAGGPRSVTHLSGQKPALSKFSAIDGSEVELTPESLDHASSKHGHNWGVNDPLPLTPNQKKTKYFQTRTRLNKANKAKVSTGIGNVLTNPTKTDVYPGVNVRGEQATVFHCTQTGNAVVVRTQGECAGQVSKAYKLSNAQLDILRTDNVLD